MNGNELTPPVDASFRFGEAHTLTIASFSRAERREVIVSVPARKRSRGRPTLVEPQSVSSRMVKPGVGLVKVPFFSGAFGISFSRLLDAALSDLTAQGCDRLIIDLRGCLGGSLGFARLASYLCPGRLPIGYDITRKRLRRGYEVHELPHVAMPATRFGLTICLLRLLESSCLETYPRPAAEGA